MIILTSIQAGKEGLLVPLTNNMLISRPPSSASSGLVAGPTHPG